MSGTTADLGGEQGSGATSLAYLKASKRYPGAEADAVHELDLDVPAGEICVLVGPSGCGKTTAMRMANRTVEITSGDIEIGGRSVLERKPSELRREIGYVIQQIGLFPHRTVRQNIATVPRLLDWDEDRIETRTTELLELIGLDPDYGDRYPAQLSGGQQQRIGVARALAVDPPLMLMDEPFGAIDPINRTRLQDEFLRLQERIGKTVLFVTHDVDEAIKMGDRIAVLREGGRLAQFAPPAELLARPADEITLLDIYLAIEGPVECPAVVTAGLAGKSRGATVLKTAWEAGCQAGAGALASQSLADLAARTLNASEPMYFI